MAKSKKKGIKSKQRKKRARREKLLSPAPEPKTVKRVASPNHNQNTEAVEQL